MAAAHIVLLAFAVLQQIVNTADPKSSSQFWWERADRTVSLRSIDKEPIGAGKFGLVYRAILNHSHPVVVKEIIKPERGRKKKKHYSEGDEWHYDKKAHDEPSEDSSDDSSSEGVSGFDEFNVLKQLDSRYIVQAFGYLKGEGNEEVLVMENGGCINLEQLYDCEYSNDLRVILNSHQDRLARARYVAFSVCQALFVIHSHGIIHRDISPKNILITPMGRIKVCDFGLAVRVSKHHNPDSDDAPPSGGTPIYMSRRNILGKNFGFEADYYSLGAVLVMVDQLREPFFGMFEVQEDLVNWHRRDGQLLSECLDLAGMPMETLDFIHMVCHEERGSDLTVKKADLFKNVHDWSLPMRIPDNIKEDLRCWLS